MRQIARATCWSALFACLLCCSPVRGDINQLTELVSADVGLCLELHRLEESLPRMTSGAIFNRLRENEIFRRWMRKSEFQKLKIAGAAISQASGEPG